MSLRDELSTYVSDTFRQQWSNRDGQKVPSPEDVRLGNEGVRLDATVLYADLDGSTNLVDNKKPHFAAEVYKTYLYCTAKIIRSCGGTIVSYDGDRIMAVYIGSSKNTSAVDTALKINWAVSQLINPALKKQYNTATYKVRQVVGIDTSPLMAARTGIRGTNDLVWVGRAANHAAKLTELSADYPTWISGEVYDMMHESAQFGGTPRQNMWEERVWTSMGRRRIYRSSWRRSFE